MATFLACEVGLTMGLQWLQIWALYDELDDMPRTWVRIMKVSRKPSFRAWFRWLEPLNLTLQERQWEQVKAVPFSLLDPPSCIWLLFFFLLSPSLLSCPWLLWVSSYLDNKHHRCASSFFMMPYALERDMRERERWGGGDKTTLLLTGNTEVHRGRKCQMVISLITQGPQSWIRDQLFFRLYRFSCVLIVFPFG